MSYIEAASSLLEMYSLDNTMAETDADMMQFTRPSNKMPTEYDEAL